MGEASFWPPVPWPSPRDGVWLALTLVAWVAICPTGWGAGRPVGVWGAFLGGACMESLSPPWVTWESDKSISSPSRLREGTSGREVHFLLGSSRRRRAVGDAAGVGEYKYSRKGVVIFLGIVFGLAKDGKKKCAPVA